MTQRYRDGGGAQSAAAYARAVRRGPFIAVSGTAAMGADGQALHPGDTEAQTRACFERALAALEALGAGFDDVIRTRVLLTPDADPGGAVRVHRELFEGREPASTLVYVAGFVPAGRPRRDRARRARGGRVRAVEVAIVGAGVSGLSIALHLRERGIGPVIVLERSGVNAGASGVQPGGVRRQWSTREHCLLAHESYDVLPRARCAPRGRAPTRGSSPAATSSSPIRPPSARSSRRTSSSRTRSAFPPS